VPVKIDLYVCPSISLYANNTELFSWNFMIHYQVISFLVKIALHDDVYAFLNASPAHIGFTHMTDLQCVSTALKKKRPV
jgi:hypothetical protein